MTDKLLEKLEQFMPVLISAVIVFMIGATVIKLLTKGLAKALKRSKVDPTAHDFLVSLVRSLMYVLLVIIVLSMLSVPMTSIIATLSAAGLAIGLALQSSLSNVAGGFIIMFSQPFHAGDFVEINGVTGTVTGITVLYTRLLTIDNKAVLIPNGTVSASTIINYTQEDLRRLDMRFSIDYKADHRLAQQLVYQVLENEPLALDSPDPPSVVMCEHSASAIKLLAKVWVKSDKYWELNYSLLEKVKDAFDKNGISIPYDQLDVHISSDPDGES